MRLLIGTVLAIGLAWDVSAATAPNTSEVVQTYSNVAQAMYDDALSSARTLQAAVDAFIANPTAETQEAAHAAWKAARVPYQQTEGLRFGNTIVDDWEGKVNAWPLDEGLIDYVDASYGTQSDANPLYTANVIATKSLSFGGKMIDATNITKDLLANQLHEAGDSEANVATGYHAIEFLLWGQDLNGTGPGAGARPATDYDLETCTHGNCDRRAAYLKAATDLLVNDLQVMAANWAENGAARDALVRAGDKGALAIMLKGLGSLSYGELAGERIKLGLMLHDPEEEHDCFSDNTHNSHYYDQVGMIALYSGHYVRPDGSVVGGRAISSLIAATKPDVDKAILDAMRETKAAMDKMKSTADSGKMAYDQMIGEGNAEGNAILDAVIEKLVAQTHAIEKGVAALGLSDVAFEGSDSLDNPSAVAVP